MPQYAPPVRLYGWRFRVPKTGFAHPPEHHASVVAFFNENATIGLTAGPLLEAVDRNLRPAIPMVPLGVAIVVVAVLGLAGWRAWRNRRPSIIDM